MQTEMEEMLPPKLTKNRYFLLSYYNFFCYNYLNRNTNSWSLANITKTSSSLLKIKYLVFNMKNVNYIETQVSSYFDDGLFRYYLLNERFYKILNMSVN